MIDYNTVLPGEILRVVGAGAPGYAKIGELVKVIEVHTRSVLVENRDGETAEFYYDCGAARLEPTEFTDIPALDQKEA